MPTLFRLARLASLPLLLAATPVLAQDVYESRTYGPTSGWSWSAHVDHINIDAEAAAEQACAIQGDNAGTHDEAP